jgi:hypothetical protein
MTNYDVNGEKVSLVAGETVSSASDQVDLGPAKAVAATVATIAVAFLGALGVAITDNVVTGQEWVTIAIATIVATGLVGGATYLAPASITGK